MAKNNQQYGSSNVLVRVYEKNLLSPEYFERLVRAKNTEDVDQILSETIYDEYISEMMNGNIEEVLTDALRDAYEQIFKVSPNPQINEYISLRYTYHNIKINFKDVLMERDLSHLSIPISPISRRAIDYAVGSGESQRLPELYLESIIEARSAYEEYRDLYGIDVILDRRYLTHLRALAGEIGDDNLIAYTERVIDYQNIITLVRAMNQNRTRNFLNAVLSSSGSIPKEEIMNLAQQDFEAVARFYKRTHLGKIIEELDVTEDKLSTLDLEALIDREKMLQMHEGKRVATGPLPIIAYIHAKEVEIMNLRIIYYAKQSNMSIDEIRERMRINYVT